MNFRPRAAAFDDVDRPDRGGWLPPKPGPLDNRTKGRKDNRSRPWNLRRAGRLDCAAPGAFGERGTTFRLGIGDIAKQIFYQMAFQNLAAENKNTDGTPLAFVNAFLFPEDDNSRVFQNVDPGPVVSELLQLGWKSDIIAKGFENVPIFGVRLPGIKLLKRYANGDTSDDWFKKIVDECEKFKPQPQTKST